MTSSEGAVLSLLLVVASACQDQPSSTMLLVAHGSPPKRIVISGDPDPDLISTSFVERSNLTMRMAIRRFMRKTNAFSKKLRNHCAAVALHVAYYNFARVHETIRMTPAMALG